MIKTVNQNNHKPALAELAGLPAFSAYMTYLSVALYLPFCRVFNAKRLSQTAKILALKECKTIEDYQLISGDLMADTEQAVDLTREEVIEQFKGMTEESKRAVIIECMTYASMKPEQVLSILKLYSDPNGVSYELSNLKSLSPELMTEMIVSGLVELSKLDFDFGTLNEEDEKILSDGMVAIKDEVAEIVEKNERISLRTLVPLAVKSAAKKVRIALEKLENKGA